MQTRCGTYWPTRRSSCRRFRRSNRRSASPGCGRTSAASAAGAEHERRRALAVAEIDRLEPDELRRDARERAAAALRDGAVTPARSGRDAGRSARAAEPASRRTSQPPRARTSRTSRPRSTPRIARSLASSRPAAESPTKLTAARIGLLVQACDATAGLVERAVAAMPEHEDATVDEILAGVLREDPPVRATRRLAAAPARIGSLEVPPGTIVTLDLTAGGDDRLPFGSGRRPCPGREHALAIAAGCVMATS